MPRTTESFPHLGQKQFLCAHQRAATWHLVMSQECPLTAEQQAIQLIARTKCCITPTQILQGFQSHMMKNVTDLAIIKEGKEGSRKPCFSFQGSHNIMWYRQCGWIVGEGE